MLWANNACVEFNSDVARLNDVISCDAAQILITNARFNRSLIHHFGQLNGLTWTVVGHDVAAATAAWVDIQALAKHGMTGAPAPAPAPAPVAKPAPRPPPPPPRALGLVSHEITDEPCEEFSTADQADYDDNYRPQDIEDFWGPGDKFRGILQIRENKSHKKSCF